MKLACTACSQIIDSLDLCPHRNPVGWCCCADEHPWHPEQYDEPEDAA
jgi:hypothetical protein